MTILFDRALYKDLPKDLKKKVYQAEKGFINSHYEEMGTTVRADRWEIMDSIDEHVYTFIELPNGEITMERDGRY